MTKISGTIASTMYVLRSTVHTTAPNFFFEQDSISNWRHDADWETVRNENKTLSIKVTKVKIVTK